MYYNKKNYNYKNAKAKICVYLKGGFKVEHITRIITFWSVDGGTGKTTLAVNSALRYALTNPNKKILLMDWNENNPDIDSHLGYTPKNLIDLYHDLYADYLPINKLKQYLIQPPQAQNLYIFSGLYNIEYVFKFEAQHFVKLLEYYKNMDFDLIIIDVNSVLNFASSFVAARMCDKFVIVSDTTITSIRNISRFLVSVIERLKKNNEIIIAVNKFDNEILDKSLISKTFKGYTLVFIPKIYNMEYYLNNYQPVVTLVQQKTKIDKEKSEFIKSIDALINLF